MRVVVKPRFHIFRVSLLQPKNFSGTDPLISFVKSWGFVVSKGLVTVIKAHEFTLMQLPGIRNSNDFLLSYQTTTNLSTPITFKQGENPTSRETSSAIMLLQNTD